MWTGILASLLFASPANDAPDFPKIECGLPFAIRPVDRFADLPEPIRADILKDGPIADAGQDFNRGDTILDRTLPYRRFVRAGSHDGMRWFVWIEHGGFDGHLDILGYAQMLDTLTTFTWHRSAELSGEPCAATNAILNRVTTGAHRDSRVGAIPPPASSVVVRPGPALVPTRARASPPHPPR